MDDKDRMTEPGLSEAASPGDATPSPEGSVDLTDSAALLAGITAERDQYAKERDEYYDRLLRRSADFDNYRRRVERERAELFEYAGMEIMREILPILDDFERALKTGTSDKEYGKGMELIYQRLLETLKKMGLEPLEAAGEKFDPNVHHAVDRVTDDGIESDTVVEEYRRGYNFKGRLLRPAMVKVAVAG